MSGTFNKRPELVMELLNMPYGSFRIVSGREAIDTWPDLSDQYQKLGRLVRAFALTFGGLRRNRPQTMREQMTLDLGETFTVSEHKWDGSFLVSRGVQHCPKCRGSGIYVQKEIPAVDSFGRRSGKASKSLNIPIIRCKHLPDL